VMPFITGVDNVRTNVQYKFLETRAELSHLTNLR